jgi:hypothetical protein
MNTKKLLFLLTLVGLSYISAESLDVSVHWQSPVDCSMGGCEKNQMLLSSEGFPKTMALIKGESQGHLYNTAQHALGPYFAAQTSSLYIAKPKTTSIKLNNKNISITPIEARRAHIEYYAQKKCSGSKDSTKFQFCNLGLGGVFGSLVKGGLFDAFKISDKTRSIFSSVSDFRIDSGQFTRMSGVDMPVVNYFDSGSIRIPLHLITPGKFIVDNDTHWKGDSGQSWATIIRKQNNYDGINPQSESDSKIPAASRVVDDFGF